MPGGARGGIALDFRRGKTSKERLDIDWSYPVWKPARSAPTPGSNTVSVQREHALPLAEAYLWVADNDHRPLLIMRECERCKGTDHALLSRTMNNEMTVLLTHWFHCVKLPPNVLGKDHPFTNLFKVEKGQRVPHLFFADPDGKNHRALPGDQSQSDLWETMFSYLDRCYEGDAEKAVKQMRALLSKFDTLDSKELSIKGRIDREIEKRGIRSPKLKKLDADLAKISKQLQELFDREKVIRALALKAMAEQAVGGGN